MEAASQASGLHHVTLPPVWAAGCPSLRLMKRLYSIELRRGVTTKALKLLVYHIVGPSTYIQVLYHDSCIFLSYWYDRSDGRPPLSCTHARLCQVGIYEVQKQTPVNFPFPSRAMFGVITSAFRTAEDVCHALLYFVSGDELVRTCRVERNETSRNSCSRLPCGPAQPWTRTKRR